MLTHRTTRMYASSCLLAAGALALGLSLPGTSAAQGAGKAAGGGGVIPGGPAAMRQRMMGGGQAAAAQQAAARANAAGIINPNLSGRGQMPTLSPEGWPVNYSRQTQGVINQQLQARLNAYYGRQTPTTPATSPEGYPINAATSGAAANRGIIDPRISAQIRGTSGTTQPTTSPEGYPIYAARQGGIIDPQLQARLNAYYGRQTPTTPATSPEGYPISGANTAQTAQAARTGQGLIDPNVSGRVNGQTGNFPTTSPEGFPVNYAAGATAGTSMNANNQQQQQQQQQQQFVDGQAYLVLNNQAYPLNDQLLMTITQQGMLPYLATSGGQFASYNNGQFSQFSDRQSYELYFLLMQLQQQYQQQMMYAAMMNGGYRMQ